MFLCSPGVSKSHQWAWDIGLFNMSTSLMEVTRAYISYMKNKKEKGSLTKGGQASQYLEQYYQVWDEYCWMTPEKGQLIFPTTICWNKKNTKLDLETAP